MRFLPYIGPLIGLVGVSLAVYYHAQAVQERTPLYHIGQRATIVDASVSVPSPVQVFYKGKPLASTNVVAAVVYLWNDGKLPIKAEDILEPLSIELEPPSEILESRVLRTSKPVIKLTKLDAAEAVKSSIPISLAILEKGDGAAIQIIYAGKPDASITVKGTIVGLAMHVCYRRRISERVSRTPGTGRRF